MAITRLRSFFGRQVNDAWCPTVAAQTYFAMMSEFGTKRTWPPYL